MQKVIIYLPPQDLHCPIWIADDVVHIGEVEKLHIAVQHRLVIVIVPGDSVLLTGVSLPKLSPARLRQALPFALEEHVLADIDSLHFAMGSRGDAGNVPVAIVSHEKMQEWLSLLRTWQVQPDKLIPVSLAVPINERVAYDLPDARLLIRTEKYQGSVFEKDNLPIYASSLDEINQVLMDPETAIRFFAETVGNEVSINLLQYLYANKKSKLPNAARNRRIRNYLLSGLIALMFLYPSVSYVILKQHSDALNTKINVIYQQHFPKSTSVVAPKIRMQEKLNSLSAKIGYQQSMLLLGMVGKAITGTSGIQLTRLHYQYQRLTLELTAASSDAMSSFVNELTQQGLEVKQQQAVMNGERVTATLQVDMV